MYEYSLIETICNKLNIESNIKNMTIVHEVIFNLKTEKINKILEDFKINNNLTPVEKYIINIYLNKYSKSFEILSSNYYNNSLLNINLILGNPKLIDTLHFESLYYNHNIFKLIIHDIQKKYDKILLDPVLYKFYNIDIINKWQKTIIQKSLSKDDYFKISTVSTILKNIRWEKYVVIWKKYNEACLELKKYLSKVENFYKNKKIEIIGCYNIDKEMYKHCLETHLGFQADIIKLKAYKYLEKLD